MSLVFERYLKYKNIGNKESKNIGNKESKNIGNKESKNIGNKESKNIGNKESKNGSIESTIEPLMSKITLNNSSNPNMIYAKYLMTK
jgi:hypothetical protein